MAGRIPHDAYGWGVQGGGGGAGGTALVGTLAPACLPASQPVQPAHGNRAGIMLQSIPQHRQVVESHLR